MSKIIKSQTPAIGIVEWFRVGKFDHAEEVLKDLKKTGITRIRTGISWADWHVKDTWKWYDWLLPKLSQQAEILPCFLYTPPSQGILPKTSSPPKDPKAYADFIDVIISRYGKYFEWVELWNEPNNQLEYDFTLDYSWKIFSRMVINAAHWAKKRGKKTLLGGMSPIDPNWLQMMIDNDVLRHIDAVGIHGFPHVFDQQWPGWNFHIEQIKQVLKANSVNAELWITETGFSTWQNNEVQQWEEFKEVCFSEVDRVYWYSMHDLDPALSTIGGYHLDEREYHFGLKKNNGQEKLLYKLLKKGGIQNIDKHPHIRRDAPGIINDKYTLISGGAGFIGTNLAKNLLEDNRKVMIFDNLSRPGVEQNLRWLYENYNGNLKIQIADIRDRKAVEESVANADEIFNFSAQVAVTTSLEDPRLDFEVNALGAFNLLEAIRKSGRKIPLIFTSTNKVYGQLPDLNFLPNKTRYYPENETVQLYGLSEKRPLDFHSPYGCSKGTADQYVVDYSRSFDLNTAVFRMSCIYGPHQFGTEDQGWVAHFAINILKNKPITIYGNGKQVRDILFVKDLVNAFRLGMTNIRKLSGNAFNIGGGPKNTVSILEILGKINSLSGKKASTTFEDWRVGDQKYYVTDFRKFSDATGWHPEYNVDRGLKMLIKWIAQAHEIALSESLKT